MLPEIKLFGLLIPTYFAWLSLVFSLGIYLVVLKSEKDPRWITPTDALNATFWILIPGLVFARLLHVVWESPAIYAEDFLRIFMIWNGGFVYFGGLMGGLLGLYFFCKSQRLRFYKFTDFFAPVIALGYGFGRFACFLAGCCYGNYCDLPWAIQGRHPVQLYSLALEVLHGSILFFANQKWKLQKNEGIVSGIFLIVHGGIRFGTEFYRADFRGDFILGLSISSWISLCLIVAGSVILIKASKGNQAIAGTSK